MATEKHDIKTVLYSHRENSEWLTAQICAEYRKKGQALEGSGVENTGARRALQKELQYRCDITELQAINIINGYHAADYVRYYENMKNGTSISGEDYKRDLEYLEWLDKKQARGQEKAEYEYDLEAIERSLEDED